MSARKDGSIREELTKILEPLSIQSLYELLETVILKACPTTTKTELQPFCEWRKKIANDTSIIQPDDKIYNIINEVLQNKKTSSTKQEKLTQPNDDHDSAKHEQKYNNNNSTTNSNSTTPSPFKLKLNKDAPEFVPGNGAWNKDPPTVKVKATPLTPVTHPAIRRPLNAMPPTQIHRVRPKKFQAKFNNHAKGNFYISKEMIKRMMDGAMEAFDTDTQNDEKLAFGYYKESVAMSINDKQIDDIFETKDGKLMIIINIDLHFKSLPNQTEQHHHQLYDNTMYLIAMENDEEFRERVRWCIVDFLSAHQILYKYGVTDKDLPKSSRNMRWFKHGIKRAPVNLRLDEIDYIMRNTHFRSLPKKTSKRVTKNANGQNINNNERKSRISEYNLRYYVEQSLKNDNYPEIPTVPVVVIKGKNQWIEWKKFIEIYDDDEYQQYVGISLRFYEGNKNWRIECMDYDSGRIYYQHRLASLPTYDDFNYSYNKLSKYITTSLEIHQQRSHNNHHSHQHNMHRHHNHHNQHQHRRPQMMPQMNMNRNNMGSMSMRNVRNMRNNNNMAAQNRRTMHKSSKSTGDVLTEISFLLDDMDLTQMGDLANHYNFQALNDVLLGAPGGGGPGPGPNNDGIQQSSNNSSHSQSQSTKQSTNTNNTDTSDDSADFKYNHTAMQQVLSEYH